MDEPHNFVKEDKKAVWTESAACVECFCQLLQNLHSSALRLHIVYMQ